MIEVAWVLAGVAGGVAASWLAVVRVERTMTTMRELAVLEIQRVAHGVRAGEREAAALYLERCNDGFLASDIRNGEHLRVLGAKGGPL